MEDLNQFRENWVAELKTQTPAWNPKSTAPRQQQVTTQSDVNEAIALYYQGAQLEDDGDCYGALVLFRKAYKLDPDLDRHLVEALKNENEENTNPPKQEEEQQIISQFGRLKIDAEITQNWDCGGTFETVIEQKHRHILELPDDCLTIIFQYVVGRRMDLASMNSFAMSCKLASNLVSNNHYLWGLLANRSISSKQLPYLKQSTSATNIPIGKILLKQIGYLRFHGVYVSKITYFRDGVPDIGGCYKPFHHIEYFRLILFYEDSEDALRCVYFTSALNPQVILNMMLAYLRSGTLQEGMMAGGVRSELCRDEVDENDNSRCYMRLSAEVKPCDLHVKKNKDEVHRMAWRIYKKKLIWTGHDCSIVYYKTPDDCIQTDFFKGANLKSYPKMYFTPVKSLQEVDNPLFPNKKL